MSPRTVDISMGSRMYSFYASRSFSYISATELVKSEENIVTMSRLLVLFAFVCLVFLFPTAIFARSHPPLRIQDFASFARAGTGSVVGVVETSSPLGRRRFAGVRVYAVPFNAYTVSMTDAFRDDWVNLGHVYSDHAIDRYVFSGVTDDDGVFRISGLPMGRYIVYAFTNQVTADTSPALVLVGGVDGIGESVDVHVPELTYLGFVRDVRFLEAEATVAGYPVRVSLLLVDSGRGGGFVTLPDATAVLSLVSQPFAPSVGRQHIAAVASEGDANVSGRLLGRLDGMPEPDVFRGVRVSLWPVTMYAYWLADDVRRAWTVGATRRGGPRDSAFLLGVRSVVSDGDGRFSFSSVPAGEYVVVAGVVESYSRRSRRVFSTDQSSPAVDAFWAPGAGAARYVDSRTSSTYACRTAGVLMSYVTAKSATTVSSPMAPLVQRNEGC